MCRDIKINKNKLCVLLALITLGANANSNEAALQLEVPELALTGVTAIITVSGAIAGEQVSITTGDNEYRVNADASGEALFEAVTFADSGSHSVSVTTMSGVVAAADVRVLPGWVSVMPPLVAILVALTIRNVIPALLVGLWFGAPMSPYRVLCSHDTDGGILQLFCCGERVA